MICLMHEGVPYGYLKVGDKVLDKDTLARMVGASPAEVEAWLQELKHSAVYSIDTNGCIYSRRMVKDEKTRTARAAGGKKSIGHPNVPKPRTEPVDNSKKKRIPSTPPLTPPPASASAVASAVQGKPTPLPPIPDLPAWLPVESWQGYLAMRIKIKKPMTDRAKKMAIEKLEKLREQGHDPKAVLDQSEFHSWQGLFEVKPTTTSTNGRPGQATLEDHNRLVADEFAKRQAEALRQAESDHSPPPPPDDPERWFETDAGIAWKGHAIGQPRLPGEQAAMHAERILAWLRAHPPVEVET